MGKTVVEKVFSLKSSSDAKAGDVVVAAVDQILANDASGPLAIDYFEKMGLQSVFDPAKITAIIDHYVPCPNSRVAGLQQMLYDFKAKYNIRVVDAGRGIAHQVFDELGLVVPGEIVIGCDSHTTTHGYLSTVSIGVGASDLASAMGAGELWFKVPETIRVNLSGRISPEVSGKDVALYLLRMLGANGANYKALEFHGEGIASLSMDDRKTICNLAAECCAKCAIMPLDEQARSYCRERGISVANNLIPDADCVYCRTIDIDLSSVHEMLALPSQADNSVPLAEKKGLKVDMVVIGTCTNGRISDFEKVDEIVSASTGHFKTETLIIPASAEVLKEMDERGYLKKLIEKGGMLLPPGCGPCCGSSPGTPRDGFVVVSTANRNFLGRMGNTKAEIYLASPMNAAKAALSGEIGGEYV